MSTSFIAHLRQQLTCEHEAAQYGLSGLAMVASHQSIIARREHHERGEETMSQEPAQPSHSYLFDPEDPFELSRLMNLDPLMSRLLGHPLAGLSATHVARLDKVLDLACGPGGWVLDLAFAHRRMQVVGVDISTSMITYASARARTQHQPNA